MNHIKHFYYVHEYGSNHHVYGFSHLLSKKKIQLNYYEFRFFRMLLKGIYYKKYQLLKKSFINFLFFVKFIFYGNKNHHVLLAVAPYDIRIILLIFVFRNVNLYWHNSWPHWDKTSKYPKKSNLLTKFFWQLFFKRINHAFFVTKYGIKNFQSLYPEVSFKLSDVHHSYPNIFNRKIVNKSFKKNQLNILFCGQLDDHKGIDLFLRLSIKFSDHIFHIVGSGPKSNIISKLNQKNLIFYKSVKNKTKLVSIFDKCDLIVLPSKEKNGWVEAFGMVIIESMSRGIVPIASNHPGPNEIMSKYFGDNLFEEDEIESGAIKKIFFYNNNRDKLRIHQKLAKNVSKKYNLTNISKKWSQILKY